MDAILRIILLFIMFVSFQLFSAQNACIVYEGHYDGKNVYIQNPFAGIGKEFCVTKVKVNGQYVSDQISSSAFEIDLKNLKLKIGDPVVVKIEHKTDCLPKVLGPEPITPKCTFRTKEIHIVNDTLKWTTTNEQGKMTFIIEQYRWNKWIKVGERIGTGINIENTYSCPVTAIAGLNKFRVKQVDYSGKPCISPEAAIESGKKEVRMIHDPSQGLIKFSDSTFYEVFDEYENMVKKGFSCSLDMTDLEKGKYWINYDSVTGKELNLNKIKAKKIKHGKNNIRRKSD